MVIPTAPEPRLTDGDVDRLFHALADSTRRDIVTRTLHSDTSVSALAARYEMSFTAVHKHVLVLENAGLVTKHRRGREKLVRGNPATLHSARTLLNRYETLWRERTDRLDALLAED